MKQITEQQILSLAPNPAAVANGRKISQKGGFVRLERSADDTFYMGECTGSGKINYITSADFVEEGAPVFRCSCPSRQFPCKHSLALLFEIMAGKKFEICEIPEDIVKKREKKQTREAKAQEKAAAAEGGFDENQAEGKKTGISKAAQNAKARKIKKQLEGLDLTGKLVSDLLRAGLGTMGGTALDTYRQLSRQLGDYYLPGPQRLLNRLILEIEQFQKDGKESHYEAAIDVLEKMGSLVKKSRVYLTEKLENGDVSQDDNLLYEELGGIWKLSELSALGRSRQNVKLIQTAFWVEFDAARSAYIDTGCWVDLESGEVSMTYNYRPLKALKYIKQEDSVFGVAEVPEVSYYPGEGNLRVRWEHAAVRPAETEELEKLYGFGAASLKAEGKAAKNLLKNALADPMLIRLVAYEKIGRTDMGYTLLSPDGSTILLGDRSGMEATTVGLSLLPEDRLLKNQVLLGAFFCDTEMGRLKIQPISIITKTGIVRLLF